MAEMAFTVNGDEAVLRVDEDDTLVAVLRDRLGLTGTVVGCGWGHCGACSVLMNDELVTACTTPATEANGRRILTVEGLEDADGLHPLQDAFLRHRAVQCGYCTPGMMIAAVAALRTHGNALDEATAREAISHNVCRCTGYASIVAAMLDVAVTQRESS
jgi:aerobic-type carbon monoxide dehydrogenase small subunit (CoxS/CutS family)